MIRQAVILCAGFGTRLRPYTDAVPKPMLPFLGKPMLEWNLRRFREYGVREFFFNLHYLPDVIRDYFGDGSKWGAKINYQFEPAILGTAGGVKQFEDALADEFFIMYGDILSMLNYHAMEAAWRKKPDALGMQRVSRATASVDADLAELDSEGKFTAIHPKPHAEHYSSAYRMRGIFIVKREILALVPPHERFEIGKELLPEVVRRGDKFYGYECDDYSKGIDTVEKWREAEEYLKKHGLLSVNGTRATEGVNNAAE